VFEIKRIVPGSNFDLKNINELLAQQSPGDKRGLEADEVQEALANPFFHFFVATESGSEEYVGMATIFFQRNLARWIAEIHDVVVDKERRGHGFGEALVKKLLETAHAFSKARNVKLKLYLTSRPSRTAANSLYEKLGFVLVAGSHGAWGTNLYKIIVEPTGFRGLP
jgi:ribosomal protein S18 acetylase RimI-like enzyme